MIKSDLAPFCAGCGIFMLSHVKRLAFGQSRITVINFMADVYQVNINVCRYQQFNHLMVPPGAGLTITVIEKDKYHYWIFESLSQFMTQKWFTINAFILIMSALTIKQLF